MGNIRLTILRLEEEILRKRGGYEGDNESDDEHLKSKKPNTGKKVKKAWINQLQVRGFIDSYIIYLLSRHISKANIRKHTMHLMDRDTESDPIPPPPSREDVQQYLDGVSKVGPSRTNFVIDLEGGSASPWNKAVNKIFVDDFLKIDWYKFKDRKAIEKGFKAHMETLQKYYRRQLKDGDSSIAVAQRLSKASRNRRKLQVPTTHSPWVPLNAYFSYTTDDSTP